MGHNANIKVRPKPQHKTQSERGPETYLMKMPQVTPVITKTTKKPYSIHEQKVMTTRRPYVIHAQHMMTDKKPYLLYEHQLRTTGKPYAIHEHLSLIHI